MNKNTLIYNRFEWWRVADCACELCVHYRGKKCGCELAKCAVEDIRAEALRREQAAQNSAEEREEGS